MPFDWSTIRGVIADMDGVLWRDKEILPGASAFFQQLAADHIPYTFATNNSTRTAAYYVEKISALGIKVSEAQIISSSIATADYLKQVYPRETCIYVVGEIGIREVLQTAGFTLIESIDEPVQLVVVGLDRDISYQKLHFASTHIRRGAIFIATNPDKTFPIPGGLSPGAGSIVAAVAAAAGKSPDRIVGKPGFPMFQIALQHLGTAPHETLMIGDRLETDIEGAAHVGIRTALVLSGVTADRSIIAESSTQPDIIADDLAGLLAAYGDKFS